jgi:hypothetical protein
VAREKKQILEKQKQRVWICPTSGREEYNHFWLEERHYEFVD